MASGSARRRANSAFFEIMIYKPLKVARFSNHVSFRRRPWVNALRRRFAAFRLERARFGKMGPGEGNLSRDSKGCLPRTNPATDTAGTLDPEILAANRPRSGTFLDRKSTRLNSSH